MTHPVQSAPADAFRRRGRLFATITTFAIVAIVAVVGLTLFVVADRWNVMTDRTLQRLVLAWSATPFYLWALWSLRTMFATFARSGLAFHAALTAALVRIGWALLLGACTALLTAPLVLALAMPRSMSGSFATFNVPALTIGVVGLALLATAHMVRRGAEVEVERAALQAELGEFF